MKKFNLYFTLDYEIHGNGDGNPMELMVEPTYRLMTLLEKYGQKLTIMADVAEIVCFKRYKAQTGKDDYYVTEIEEQLRDAIRRGHDVQLHIHSSYFRAVHNGYSFEQFIDEYNMAALPIERMDEMVEECVSYLENLLKPVKPDYKVWLFRAANWSMMPTENLYRVLVKYGITHDTSVYKGGCQGGNVCYDYRNAYSNLLTYPASEKDINNLDPNGKLIEMPIYTEMRPFWAFISPMRMFRMIRAKFHKHKHSSIQTIASEAANQNDNRKLTLKSFFRLSPLKMDFNQVSGRGLIRMMKHIENRAKRMPAMDTLNVILIGHSKTFIPYNEKTLQSFLEWMSDSKL